jgi:hypothetical protein
MHPIIQKTLGGLSVQYYLRQLFFGLAVGALIFYGENQSDRSMSLGLLFLIVINTLLYPYSRFVYESIVDFIVGDGKIFIIHPLFMILAKVMTMLLCWFFALFIAPFGLAYLYYHHSKAGT